MTEKFTFFEYYRFLLSFQIDEAPGNDDILPRISNLVDCMNKPNEAYDQDAQGFGSAEYLSVQKACNSLA